MRVFFSFGILNCMKVMLYLQNFMKVMLYLQNFMKVMLYLQNFIRVFAQTCHFPFSTNIQFTLILLLLLILDNDIHQNPGPQEYKFSVFHLNARSVRNKLSYLEDIHSFWVVYNLCNRKPFGRIMTLLLMVFPTTYLEKIGTVLGVAFSCILLKVFVWKKDTI
jgi:hypothetical protein